MGEGENDAALYPHAPTDSLTHSPTHRIAWVCALLVSLAFNTYARINVVTLPDRDTVQLTIYNSVDLTLVKETRHLTFRKD